MLIRFHMLVSARVRSSGEEAESRMLTVTAPPPKTQPTERNLPATLDSQQSTNSSNESPSSQYSIPPIDQERSLRVSRQGDHYAPQTPSTSLSNPSSQDDLGAKPGSTGYIAAGDRVNASSSSSAMPTSMRIFDGGSPQQRAATAPYPAAPKRTADGHMKTPSTSMPKHATDHGHSSTSSAASRSSQISEVRGSVILDAKGPHVLIRAQLSHRLKTRLSYATIKVQIGLQDRNIGEVETIVKSQPCSPVSAVAPTHHSRKSSQSMRQRPGTTRALINGSPRSVNGTTSVASPRDREHDRRTLTQSSPSRNIHARQNMQCSPPRTYESFWEERSVQQLHPHFHYAEHADPRHHLPSLAPPVDIVPHDALPGASDPCRGHTRNKSSLGSPFRQLSSSSSSSASHTHHASIPLTPPPLPAPPHNTSMKPPPMRTPSQNAAMEADAVETLLFMSSPENAHPRSSAAVAPGFLHTPDVSRPRTDVWSQRNYHGPATAASGHGSSSFFGDQRMGPPRILTNGQVSPKKKDTTRDIDRMLDEMESSSSDDE